MHAYRPAQGPARTKLLYIFRSPSHVQIGRKALDPEVREALEHTHPDLTFDWNGLLRDSPPPVRQPRQDPSDPRERRGRGQRQKAGRSGGGTAPRGARPTSQVPDGPPDDSLLGRAVGATEAARLRHRYHELVQRVGRRARTPEERDQLMADLMAANPDAWSGGEAAVREQARGADGRWAAIAARLPKRRRGRRGGKPEDEDQMASGDVIIGEREQTDERITKTDAPGVAAAGDRDADRPAGATDPGADPPASDVRQPD